MRKGSLQPVPSFHQNCQSDKYTLPAVPGAAVCGLGRHIEVRGNRYSVGGVLWSTGDSLDWPGPLAARGYGQDRCVAEHRLRPAGAGWQSIPAHHAALWQDTLQVERRGLAVYEEAGQWN